ncbi:MAG: tetratricopeptide repeat protein [Gallionella sp.]
MGILDQFRSATPSPGGDSKPDTSGQSATRLIDEGHALEAQGRLNEAMQRYLEAIRLAPNPARGHLNRGNVLLLQGDLNSALDAFRTALEHQPDYAGAYYNIGNALLGNQQLDEAVASYHSALKINPDYAEVHCSLGIALKELGQFDSAIACFRKALEIDHALVEAHLNLDAAIEDIFNKGNILMGSGQLGEAVAHYRQLLEIKPDYAEAHTTLGVALRELGQIESAVACYRRALLIKPDLAHAHYNLGAALKDLGQLHDAVASYHRALAIKPDFLEAHNNLLFSLNYTASKIPSYYSEQVRQYGRIVSESVAKRFSAWQCAGRPERLRVGLISGDFLNHPVGFFLEGLLAHIDPARIELIAYPTRHNKDELTDRIRPYFSHWKPLAGKSNESAANMIHADGVNILLDLSGHVAHNRLPVFAWKPAPVQVSWLGYFATTGVAEIDYILADEVGVPKDSQAQFTESVWYLPDTRLCFTAPNNDLPVAMLPALNNGHITFGCFQNLTKLGDEVLETWREIFDALPNTRLRLQCDQFCEPAQAEQFLQRVERCGIDKSRVTAYGSTNRAAYLAEYAEVDMILDTFPYTGGTTTCEALWMGVPTLTLAGDTLLARQGASLLTAAGLVHWVATSKQEYIDKAIALASDQAGLVALRADLREQVLASPLFDAPRFARNFEDALWEMWQRYQSGYKSPRRS